MDAREPLMQIREYIIEALRGHGYHISDSGFDFVLQQAEIGLHVGETRIEIEIKSPEI